MPVHTAAALSRSAESGVAAVEAADAVASRLAFRARPAQAGPAGEVSPPAAEGTAAVPAESPRCDLVVVTVTPAHADHLDDVAAAIEARLEPGVLLGAVASGVVGPGVEVADGPAVAVWALAAPGGWVQPFRVWTLRPASGGVTVVGWPDTEPGDVTLVLGDPHDLPATELAARLSEQRPGSLLLGGLVSGGLGRSRFVVDGRVHSDGAVGVVLRDIDVTALVSIGCSSIGRPVTVTEAVEDRILSLAGEPATDYVDRLLSSLPASDLARLEQGGLQIGTVVDEVRDEYHSGDFQLRHVLAIDAETGALTVGDRISPGSTVQFHLPDPIHAGADLAGRLRTAGPAAGALLFTSVGRGVGLFEVPGHDARTVQDHLDVEVAGAVTEGEFGPLGARSVLHTFAAAVTMFDQPAEDQPAEDQPADEPPERAPGGVSGGGVTG